MTSKALYALFEKYSHEDNFDAIFQNDKLNPNQFLCGLLKIASLLKNPSKFPMVAEHDVVYLAGIDDLVDNVCDHDVVYLRRCGIFYDANLCCLATFT